MLAPTTILAYQHYRTFLRRFASFPVTIELLTRYYSAREQKAILAKLESGEIDVIIGTHRVLSKDIKLKDVGLLVAVEQTDVPAEHASVRLNLELLGADHPGIVAEISAALAAQGIGIEELSTDVREAPMSGGMLFEASAVLEAPPATSMQELRSMLEAVADELMVEIRLSDTPPSTRPNGH